MSRDHEHNCRKPSGSTVRALVAVVLLASLCGCRSVKMGLARRYYTPERFRLKSVEYGARSRVRISNKVLEESELSGPVSAGDVEVYHAAGLEDLARRTAEQADAILTATEKRAGFENRIKLRYYIFRVDVVPGNVDFEYRHEKGEAFYAVPLFLRPGEGGVSDLIGRHPASIAVPVHELAEYSLYAPGGRPVVMPDGTWPFLYYTRWFRDGYASYAALIATEVAREQLGITPAESVVTRHRLHGRLLAALEEVGTDLFSWTQKESADQATYYDASLGLFLMLRERYGEEGIRRVMSRLGEHDYVDGRGLIEATNDALGTDITKTVEDFRLPRLGFSASVITPALREGKGLQVERGLLVRKVRDGGPLSEAGVAAGDVITAVDGSPIAGALDFELAIFRAMPKGKTLIEVLREGNTEIRELTLAVDEGPRKSKSKKPRPGKAEGLNFGLRGGMEFTLEFGARKPSEAE